MSASEILYLVGFATLFIGCLLVVIFGPQAGLHREHRPDWRAVAALEQQRADQWRTLWERQRKIDELSSAAARHEQFDLDRRARVLGWQPGATRRTEP